MKRVVSGSLLGVALLALSVMAAGAEELTVNSILTSYKAGAPADGIVAMVNNPANSIAMTAGDLVTLRDAGLPEAVIAAVYARLPAPTPTSVPLVPDDTRLVDLVHLVKSGISASIIAEQVKQSGQAYNLSVNDLLYLKQNGAPELTIAALMATGGGASAAPGTAGAPTAPTEMVFDGLLMKATFMGKNRPGSLVMQGDTLAWVDSHDSDKNFSFKITGVEKVWLTCQAQAPENFCYQINFQIVKGDRYRFQDVNRKSGSNDAVLKVMDALRTYFPRLAFGAPDNG
jgi:hypothetical protein